VLVVALLAAAVPAFSAEKILASRVWPAQEYTRVTFESARPIKHQSFSVPRPSGSWSDLEGVGLQR
jgi:N-acetylmuramoyl-L-alanine amidase